MRRKVVSFPLSVGFFPAAHSCSAIRAVFPPVGLGEKIPATLGTAFPVCPVQKGGFQFPVQRQYGYTKPAAYKRIADTLDAYARLAVIQQDTVAVIVIAALMHKAAGGSVLWVVHVWAFTVHFLAPFPVPAHGARFCQDCFSRSAIPGRSLSSPGTRCKRRSSLW